MKSVFSERGLQLLEESQGFATAPPFPHLVLDKLFDPDALSKILVEWPGPEAFGCDSTILDADDRQFPGNDGVHVKNKIGTGWMSEIGPDTRAFFDELARPRFLKYLERATNMWGLIPDPYMIGGGLHATRSGGSLEVHADFNRHPIYKLERRLNILIYLNEEWTEDNRGWLELWNHDMSACEKRVLPVFNRTVIFATSRKSFHGQPVPISGPRDLWRKSAALYYYSNGMADLGQPPSTEDEHSTSGKSGRPKKSRGRSGRLDHGRTNSRMAK